jgi:hypothetical protein
MYLQDDGIDDGGDHARGAAELSAGAIFWFAVPGQESGAAIARNSPQ